MSTPSPTTTCEYHDHFTFNKAWWWFSITIASICVIYVYADYILNKSKRHNPSLLMVMRSTFDYLAVIVVLYAITTDRISCDTSISTCRFWGSLFLFCLYVPAIYYGSICWQLYLTLKNPFRQPSSHSILFHLSVILFVILLMLFISFVGSDGNGQFVYRAEFQICFLKSRVGINGWNVAIIYIPTFVIVFGGIVMNFWSIRQLKRRVLDDTFKLRWSVIKTQTAIITCFTINYVLQGILWIIIFEDTEQTPVNDPYLLASFCMIAIIIDSITWCIRNYVQHKSSKDLKQDNTKIGNTISDALRKEVITFITAGLAQSCTMNSQKNMKRKRKRSYNYNNNNVESVESLNSSLLTKNKNKNKNNTKNLTDDSLQFQSKKIGNFSTLYNYNKSFIENYWLLSDDEKSDHDIDEDDIKYNKSKHSLDMVQIEAGNKESSYNDHYKDDILSDKYYPKNIDDKYMEHVIEQYPIGSVGAEQTNVVFTDYAPVIFSYLRRQVFGVSDESYKQSILPETDVSKVSLDLIAKFSEGRSGAFFFFTKDMKYLIKTLTKSEAQLLLSTLREYTIYLTENQGQTYLSNYFGLHSIKLYNHSIYFVVNKNVFPSKHKMPDEIYDIKGSWVDRNTNHHVSAKKLMKDGDLHTKLVLNEQQSALINEQLKKDTQFLCDCNIMDYSLLLGIYYTKVHRNNQRHKSVIHLDRQQFETDLNKQKSVKSVNIINLDEYDIYDASVVIGPGRYCIGIIDMLQEWDLNKKLERFIKGLRGKNIDGISAVPPKQYQERFMDKMMEIGLSGIENLENDNQFLV